MGLQFVPAAGTVLLCGYDFGRTSVDPHEMTKRRPVVVLSAHRRDGAGPYLVVPFSTTAPAHLTNVHYRIPAGTYSFFTDKADVWAKCDFVSAVGRQRLGRLQREGGSFTPQLHDVDLRGIRLGVVRALGAWPLL